MNARIFLLLVYFLSGACGLLFELIWSRRLTLLFGATVYAVATVLAVYMAGLALGSLLFSRRAERAERPAFMLSLVLTGAGLTGAAVLPLLDILQSLYLNWVGGLAWGSPAAAAGRVLMSAAVLIVPCTLMGATFPLMGRVYAAFVPQAGRNAGHVYAANTLGAVAGCLLTGFAAIPLLGLSLASAAGGAGYLLLAAGLKIAALWPAGSAGAPAETEKPAPGPDTREAVPVSGRVILAAAAIAGLTALSYEVVWTRVLQVFLRNSPYTFAVILASFLLGIALGSLIASRAARGIDRSLRLFVLCQALIALSAMVLQPVFGKLPSLIEPLAGVAGRPALMLFLPGMAAAFAFILIPAVFMGLAFPLLCQAYVESTKGRLALGLGRVYGFNTLGAIAGSLIAGFILIPRVGTSGGNLLLALVNLALAAFVLRLLGRRRAAASAVKKKKGKKHRQRETGTPARAWILLGLIALLDLTLLAAGVGSPARTILPPSVFRTAARDDRVLYYKETAPGTVVVVEDERSGLRSCFVNNNVVCGTSYDALKVIRMLGHLPMMLRGDDSACRALVIGFGTGVTSGSILRYPWVEKLDCVEICPGVLDAAAYFQAVNHGAQNDPRLRFIAGDGRNYVDACRSRYDVISCDPTHPALGCGALYSVEYFMSCRRLLRDGGIICQYLPLHKMSERHFKIALATFHEVFPRMTVWLGFSHGIMVGRRGENPPGIDVDFVARLMAMPDVSRDLYACHLETPYDLFSTFVLGPKDVKALVAGEASRNTDDHPVLEYSGPEALRPDVWFINMNQLLNHMASPLPYLLGPGPSGPPRDLFTRTLDRYFHGKRRLYHGLIAWRQGDLKRAHDYFLEGLKANPEDLELSDMADLAKISLEKNLPLPFATE